MATRVYSARYEMTSEREKRAMASIEKSGVATT